MSSSATKDWDSLLGVVRVDVLLLGRPLLSCRWGPGLFDCWRGVLLPVEPADDERGVVADGVPGLVGLF